MPLYGEIIVIKRDGTDGTHFPLTANSCLFGRKRECDIRIQLPQVSKEHCKIEVNENKEVIFFNLSSVTPAQVNGNNITDPTYLKHGDVLTIIDRSFRFEYPPVSFPQKRRSRSQEKDTLQVLHVQQDLSQNSKTGTPQISDKELEQKNQIPNGNKKGQSQESVFTRNDASESAYKIHQSERKNEISFSSEFSVPVKYEDATKSTEENRELHSQDNSPRKDGNMSEDISQISNRRSANLRSTDTVTQKGVSHAGGTKNQDINSVEPHPDENSCRKPSRRSSATQSSTSLQNYVTKQKDHEDATPLKFQHTAENEPEKYKEIKGASNNYIFSASRPGTNFIPELCCIVSLDYTDETSHSQKSIDKIREVGTAEIMPNLKDSFGSDGSFLSTPASNQKHFQENSSPFTGNPRKCFLKYSILPTELDSLNEMKYAETSFETEECSLDTSTGEYEKNDMSGNTYPKRRRSSKKIATEVIQTPKEQRNEMAVNCTLKDGNSGTIASSLPCSNSKSPRRSFKQNSSVNTGTMMKISTEELFVITTGSEMGRRTGQLSDDSFGRNYHEENAEKIKQPIPDVHEENTNMKNNMPVFSSLYESDVQTPVEAVSEMNMRDPCRSNKKPEIKKSPQKRKNTEPETLFQPLGKRKRVSFGGQLSPELFDKRLPPNSPLKKGAIPARLSLPFGNSPRAVLKKASGLRQSTIKGFSEREQGNNILNEKATSPRVRKSPAASGPSRRSPAAASPPARRSPAASSAASPPARRSPAASSTASPIAQRSPAASPPARRSPAGSLRTRRSPATSPRVCFSCNTPQRKGRFSISYVTCPSPKEQSSVAIQIDKNKEITQLKTSEPTEQESKASGAVRRSKNFASRTNSLHRRSAVGAIQSKRRSGASEANLIVAKSWADVVKQGVPKSQLRTTATKCGRKRSTAKKPTKPSKNHDSILKTPVRKFTGHFTTGHANSPAPIVVGKAHISTVNLAAQVPKVMYNYPLKQHSDLNESFTGMAEMFSTPPNREQEESLSSSDRTMSKQEAALEIHTETEAEESPTPSCIVSNQQRHYKEDAISSQDSTLGQDDLQMTPRGTYGAFSETVRKDSIMEALHHTAVTGMQDKTQEKNSETVKVLSGTKRLLKTPKEKPEPMEAMSGDKRMLRTPKQKPEPMESFSGVRSLLRTPNQSQEPVQALPGVTRILRTPKQKPESVEALSGVRRFVKTPKQKPEPVESLSGVKRLLRTPKQKTGTVEVLSGIKRLLKTPRQKTEPVEALSGVRRLLRTPKQKIEPVEALSGMKELLRTPKENLAPVADEVCSKLMKSPEEMAKELMGSDTERKVKQMQLGIDCLVEEPEKRVDIDCLVEEPEKRVSPMDDFKGIQRLFRTPKQKNKPLEDLAGLSRLLKTPKQRFLPVDDYLGLQKFMTEPKQNCLTPEIDYLGIKEMLETPDEQSTLEHHKNALQIDSSTFKDSQRDFVIAA
ncbi:hypothetical protein JRQ81_018341 [Phrynocephalus forsythii]|uniref:FHA domain-containing protein n=1 Tax=Phrynocephalus forsythii TaxID=171643 RepID=A0A9Q0XS09_9SAUR|nr:hypothetical protein JRQ81_018341 [Phrynocephalus forsythii]